MKILDIFYSRKKRAILHINVSTFEQFKAGVESVKESKIPLIIGVSEGERGFLGINYFEDLIDEAKEKGIKVYSNADHTKNIKKAYEAIDYNFDFVLFDGSGLSFKKNILFTQKVVNYRNKNNKKSLIEGELGYLTGYSDIETTIELKEEYFTSPDLAKEFVDQTKVDLLAISVGNVHGIPQKIKFKNKEFKKIILNFNLIKEIKNKVNLPLVLHGGSGLTKKDFIKAINNGISIIHINTEFRKIWKEELSKSIKEKTVVPYKILDKVVKKLKRKIIFYQRLFYYI
ncbi:MAG: iron ABC transporter substrate-binding protein [Candidatus Parcubacteria bacterium]|nr:MAG: iron ABC transporter substrate-binding protein [Candidatus Parcubacteria bacterium]